MLGCFRLIRKVLSVGGWAPAAVFLIHVTATQVFDAYAVFPQLDVPMHFVGGIAMAFFISRCFRQLPRDVVRSSRLVVLEAVLIASMTTTIAVLWEFAEFSLDQFVGSNVQVGLANTMQDLALGMLGAAVVVAVRARQVSASCDDVSAVAADWMSERAA